MGIPAPLGHRFSMHNELEQPWGASGDRKKGQGAGKRGTTHAGKGVYLSLHCLPVLPGRKPPIRDHFCVPFLRTSVVSCSSSSGVHLVTTLRSPSSESIPL